MSSLKSKKSSPESSDKLRLPTIPANVALKVEPVREACGAIPKRLSLPSTEICKDYEGHIVPSDFNLARYPPKAASADDDDAAECDDNLRIGKFASRSSPRNVVTRKSPGQIYFGGKHQPVRCMAYPLPKEGTDSDSSSPDIDLYLSKTSTTTRLEPLSPHEMEVFLSNLYPNRMHRFKDSAVSERSDDGGDRYSKELLYLKEGLSKLDCSDDFLYSCKVQKTKALCVRDLNASIPRMQPLDEEDGCNSPLSFVQPTMKPLGRKTDSVADENNWTGKSTNTTFANSKCGEKSVSPGRPVLTAIRPLSTDDQLNCQAKFIVGDEPDDESVEVCSSSENTSENTSRVPCDKSRASTKPCETSPLHKSISCPSKQAFNANKVSGFAGFQKSSSLLKTVMKKELSQQPDAVAPKVNIL